MIDICPSTKTKSSIGANSYIYVTTYKLLKIN